jgi:hypothetical protein
MTDSVDTVNSGGIRFARFGPRSLTFSLIILADRAHILVSLTHLPEATASQEYNDENSLL